MTAFGTKGRKVGGGSKWIVPARRLGIYMRDEFTCAYCGKDCSILTPSEFGLDHLIPCSKGGTNQSENLTTACRRCNSSRGDRDLEDFAPGGSIDRIEANRNKPVNIELAKSILAGHKEAVDA